MPPGCRYVGYALEWNLWSGFIVDEPGRNHFMFISMSRRIQVTRLIQA